MLGAALRGAVVVVSDLRWQNSVMILSIRQQPELRSAYRAFRSISTRWSDNDLYGHVNNVVFYSWFDTAINGFLIDSGALDIHPGAVIGLVVETQCHFFAPLAFPGVGQACIRLAHTSSASVRYELAVFPADPAQPCAAKGLFVHVYVIGSTDDPPLCPLNRFVVWRP